MLMFYWPLALALVVGAGLEVTVGFAAGVVAEFAVGKVAAVFSVTGKPGTIVGFCAVATGWDFGAWAGGVVGWIPAGVPPDFDMKDWVSLPTAQSWSQHFETSTVF